MLLSTLPGLCGARAAPAVLLKLDHEDVFPEKVLKDLYDPQQIGIHLSLRPRGVGGPRRKRWDIYRVCEVMRESTSESPRASSPPASAPTDHGRGDGRAEGPLDEAPRRRGAADGLRRHGAAGWERPRRSSDAGRSVTEDGKIRRLPHLGRKQWISNGRRRGPLHGLRERPRRATGSSSRRGSRFRTESPRTSTASAPATRPRSSSTTSGSRRPPHRRRRGERPRPGPGRLRLHAPHGGRLRLGAGWGGALAGHPLLADRASKGAPALEKQGTRTS